eukprot:Colp12_sorted_trinity150504_noHs@28210
MLSNVGMRCLRTLCRPASILKTRVPTFGSTIKARAQAFSTRGLGFETTASTSDAFLYHSSRASSVASSSHVFKGGASLDSSFSLLRISEPTVQINLWKPVESISTAIKAPTKYRSDEMQCHRVLKKRRRKINHHKHRKRLKKQRAQRRRQGKI